MPKVKLEPVEEVLNDKPVLTWEKRKARIVRENSTGIVEVMAYGPLGVHHEDTDCVDFNRWPVTQLTTGYRVTSLADEGQALLLASVIAEREDLRIIFCSSSVTSTREKCHALGWFVPWIKECYNKNRCLPVPS